MQEYLKINQLAYDAIAQEFQDKKQLRLEDSIRLAAEFEAAMPRAKGQSVLELGPGSGDISRLLQEADFKVTAIEFSPSMASLALKTAPQVTMIVDEFLAHDFGSQRFNGIFGAAFIHLFTPEDAIRVVRKIHDLLEDDGVAHLSTTKHDVIWNGFAAKDNFEQTVSRYRVRYTPQTFRSLLETAGFRRIEYCERVEREAARTWMQLVCYK